jgi:hypothetical protein
MHDDFQSFRKARTERKQPLTLEIDGEEFVFPGAAPADFMLACAEIENEKGSEELGLDDIIRVIPILLGEERAASLRRALSWPEFEALMQDLLAAYGMTAEVGSDDVENLRNLQAKATSNSEPQLSTTLEQSKQISSLSTA